MAALAGCLLRHLAPRATRPARRSRPTESVKLVAIGVIGGLGSIVGPLLGAAVGDRPADDVPRLADRAASSCRRRRHAPDSALLPRRLRRRRVRSATPSWLARRRAPPPAPLRRRVDDAAVPVPSVLAGIDAIAAPPGRGVAVGRRTSRCASVAASRSTHVNLHVGAHEIVGLIGTNGAGKSHAHERDRRLRPADGHDRGARRRDVSWLRRAAGARLGLGRTFQAARLYDDLTVRETVDGRARSARPHAASCRRCSRVPPSTARERREAPPRPTRSSLRSASARSPTSSSATSRPAPAGSSSSPCVSSRSARAVAAARRADRRRRAARDRGVRPAHPRDPATSSTPRCWSSSTTCRSSWRSATVCTASRPARVIAEGSPEQVRHDPLVVACYLGTDDPQHPALRHDFLGGGRGAAPRDRARRGADVRVHADDLLSRLDDGFRLLTSGV